MEDRAQKDNEENTLHSSVFNQVTAGVQQTERTAIIVLAG